MKKQPFYRAIDWNNIEDDVDLQVWNRLTSNFWLPEKIALSNDLRSWETLTETEKTTFSNVFTNLTLLDTLQGSVGSVELMKDATNPHEEAVFSNLVFMENIHAKSYSSIFSTLLNSREIDKTFNWAHNNKYVQKKAEIVDHYYTADDPEKKKIASVLLESFLFYTGFYYSFYWASHAKLTNTADIIRLILRDESIHGYYIGYKFQQAYDKASIERKEELKKFTYDLMNELYENETKLTRELYDPVGLTDDVLKFLKYNANKALVNLGFDAYFSKEETNVSSEILTQVAPDANETFDFFSGSGSSYVMGDVEETEDDDWDF